MKKLKKYWFFTFFILSLFSVPIHAQDELNNSVFIENRLASFADSLFSWPVFASVNSTVISVKVPDDSLVYAQDLLTQVLNQAALELNKQVYRQDDSVKTKYALTVSVLSWDLINHDYKKVEKQSGNKFTQEFEARLNIDLVSPAQEVKLNQTEVITAVRYFKNKHKLQDVQGNMPGFRDAMPKERFSGFNLIETGLIVLATSTTVFLLYKFRTQ